MSELHQTALCTANDSCRLHVLWILALPLSLRFDALESMYFAMEQFVGVLYEAKEKRLVWRDPSRPSAGVSD